MRESFNEYKKTLDRALMSIDYLYAGDINSSLPQKSFSEIRENPLTSPSFVVNCISQIYKDSFDIVKERAKEVTIPEDMDSPVDMSYLVSKMDSMLGYPNKYVFTSKSSYNYIGFDSFKIDNNRGLPGYLYQLTKIVGVQSIVYYSPEVEELDDAYTVYATDHPFQSMVYSLQNMEYDITPLETNPITWEHKINYTLYDCKFSAVKIVIKNVKLLRNEKLTQILS